MSEGKARNEVGERRARSPFGLRAGVSRVAQQLGTSPSGERRNRSPKALREAQAAGDAGVVPRKTEAVWEEQKYVLTQIQEYERAKKYAVLDPRTSSFLRSWDVIMGLALIFTAVVTPFEISFMPQSCSALAPMFVINRMLDLLFIIDMVLQFNIASFDEGSNHWVTKRQSVARKYLRGWFLLDIGSIAPSSADIVMVADCQSGGSEAGSEATATTRIFRIIRVVRLLKLLRLLRSSRIFGRMMARFPLPHKTMVMLRLTILVTIAAHWSACLLAITTIFSEQGKLDTWLAAYGYCWPVQASASDRSTLFVFGEVDHTWIADGQTGRRGFRVAWRWL